MVFFLHSVVPLFIRFCSGYLNDGQHEHLKREKKCITRASYSNNIQQQQKMKTFQKHVSFILKKNVHIK